MRPFLAAGWNPSAQNLEVYFQAWYELLKDTTKENFLVKHHLYAQELCGLLYLSLTFYLDQNGTYKNGLTKTRGRLTSYTVGLLESPLPRVKAAGVTWTEKENPESFCTPSLWIFPCLFLPLCPLSKSKTILIAVKDVMARAVLMAQCDPARAVLSLGVCSSSLQFSLCCSLKTDPVLL